MEDFLGRRQILDLVAQDFHAPVRRGLIERRHDQAVDVLALLECAVELHAANDAAQRSLRELRDSHLEIARAVRRKPRVGDLEIQDSIDLELRVVLGDADLARHVERYFAQVVLVGDAIDKRNDEIQSRREDGMKSPEALDDQRVLLRNDADCLDDDDHRDDKQRERDDRGSHHDCILHGECG